MGEYALGQPVPRSEDPRLLSGGGRYVDDVQLAKERFTAAPDSSRALFKPSERRTMKLCPS